MANLLFFGQTCTFQLAKKPSKSDDVQTGGAIILVRRVTVPKRESRLMETRVTKAVETPMRLDCLVEWSDLAIALLSRCLDCLSCAVEWAIAPLSSFLCKSGRTVYLLPLR